MALFALLALTRAQDADDRWVRVHTLAGNMIVLPAGCYHRFVPDEHVFFHTMRLFQVRGLGVVCSALTGRRGAGRAALDRVQSLHR